MTVPGMNGLGTSVAEGFFWSCVSLLLYIYFGYSALIGSLVLLRSRPMIRQEGCPDGRLDRRRRSQRGRARRAAHLESAGPRLPRGTTRDPASLRWIHRSDRLRVIEFESRRGKAAVLNEVIPQASWFWPMPGRGSRRACCGRCCALFLIPKAER